MKRVIAVILGLIALAVGYRLWNLPAYPHGSGRQVASPDKHYTALASTLTDGGFWGGEHSYYEFGIESVQGDRVRTLIIKEPPEGLITWRSEGLPGEGSIEWASDSSSVTYSFSGTQIILHVKP